MRWALAAGALITITNVSVAGTLGSGKPVKRDASYSSLLPSEEELAKSTAQAEAKAKAERERTTRLGAAQVPPVRKVPQVAP